MLWHKLQGVGGIGTENIVTDNLLLRLAEGQLRTLTGGMKNAH